ncbi:MAG: DIP1984 family protein [Ardenticatenaceae bacterium]|nr:DIP1984 family protein [Ardenticatenaceae bacterium]
MKLAEALILRADYQKRIEQLKQRLVRNAKVQEGDDPAENPTELLAEYERVSQQLVTIIQQINKTNANALLEGQLTIADAIAMRDGLRHKHGLYTALAEAATITQERYSRSEVKFQSTLNVAHMQKQADDLARQYRELDTKLQSANWVTDLQP